MFFHLKINEYGQTLESNINAVLVKQCLVFLIVFSPDSNSNSMGLLLFTLLYGSSGSQCSSGICLGNILDL